MRPPLPRHRPRRRLPAENRAHEIDAQDALELVEVDVEKRDAVVMPALLTWMSSVPKRRWSTAHRLAGHCRRVADIEEEARRPPAARWR